jgi:hypothetical protein
VLKTARRKGRAGRQHTLLLNRSAGSGFSSAKSDDLPLPLDPRE